MPGDLSPTTDMLDEQTVEAILSGRRPEGDGFDALLAFASDVSAAADCPLPTPSASLAAVLSTGFSTDKGDLLATAGSNVIGPAPQAAGLPKWRTRHSMLPIPILSGLVSKIVAGVVAGLAGVTAAGAAGALPGPAQDAVATVINTVSPFNLPTNDSSVTLGADVGTTPSVSVDVSSRDGTTTTAASGNVATGGNTASATAKSNSPAGTSNAAATAAVTTPSVPGLPNLPGLGSLPGLPNLSTLPVPQCVKDIVDVNTGQPKVPLSQVAPQVVNCVRTLLGSSGAQIPAGVNQCVNSILGMAGSVTPGSVPNVAGFDWSTCVPFDFSQCMTSMMNLWKGFIPGANGGFSIPGLSGLSGLNLQGCMPFNRDACLSSIFDMAGNLPGTGTGGIPGLGAGTIPGAGDLDLSACVPFGSLGSTPGLGALSSFMPR